jgi:hypothetical protein
MSYTHLLLRVLVVICILQHLGEEGRGEERRGEEGGGGEGRGGEGRGEGERMQRKGEWFGHLSISSPSNSCPS